ncbi:lipoprotein [Arthrobacter phage Atuin]|nr:lipoprotein [Arthrobacter phage Atuin]
MKKIVVAGLVLLALSGCSQSPGDALAKTYSGPAHVYDVDQYKKSCIVRYKMLKNGMDSTIHRGGRFSCPEKEGSIIYFIGGKKI